MSKSHDNAFALARWNHDEDVTTSTIRLAPDSDERWLQTGSKDLFVRPCYVTLWNLCREIFEEGGHSGVALMGNPGIGKSCFLDFALHMLLRQSGNDDQQDPSVLYVHGKKGFAFIYQYDKPMEKMSIHDMKMNDMAKKVDFVLIDPPTVCNNDFLTSHHLHSKKFILAASLNRHNCKALQQEAQPICLYMGPTSMEESKAMRRECYPNIAEEAVKDRFEEFGGVPRYLFTPCSKFETNRRPRQDQIDALEDLTLHPCRIDNKYSTQEFEIAWALYHIIPKSKNDIAHSDYTVVPCCDDACIRIRKKLMEKDVGTLWRIFKDTSTGIEVLKRIRYEAYAHKKILRDGLMVTNLKVKVPPQCATRYVDVVLRSDIAGNRTKSKGGRYFIPSKWNSVVDLLYVPPSPQKAEIDEEHPQNARKISFDKKCKDTKVKAKDNPEVYQFQMMAGRSSKPFSDKACHVFESTGSTRLIFVVPTPTNAAARKDMLLPEVYRTQAMEYHFVVLNEIE